MDNTSGYFKVEKIPDDALKQTMEYNQEESIIDSIVAKTKRQPFLAAGVLGLTTVCGIGFYKWKTRTIPVQLFLIQLRVAAQGTALGIISLGMIYQIYQKMKPDKTK